MLTTTLSSLFSRDLSRLRTELLAYEHEADIWRVEGAINNSAGNLCLHLLGNLNTYIGHELGGVVYVRNREREFAAKGIAREVLVEEIDKLRELVIEVLAKIDPATLAEQFPVKVFHDPVSTEFMLVHLSGHLNYHLGQINYHRRLIGG